MLWWDELSTLDIARRPVAGILATAQHVDAVHSLYYVLMHFWMDLFGSSVLSVRLPSVLAMCGSTVCTAALAQRLFDRRVAITASFIFALVPGVDRYASEARSYGLVVSSARRSRCSRSSGRSSGPTTRRWVLTGRWSRSPARSTSSRSSPCPRTSWWCWCRGRAGGAGR